MFNNTNTMMYKNLDDHIRKTQTEEEWLEKLYKIKEYNVRDTSSLGHTPLTVSANYGHIKGCKYILKNGGNINLQSKDGDTAIFCAIGNAHIYGEDILHFLLEQGADITIANNDGITPLMEALRYYPIPEFIQLLVNRGANVNATNKWNMTPLMYAAETRNLAIYKILLEKGANPSILDVGGCNALHYLVKETNHDKESKNDIETLIKLLPQDKISLNITDSETGESTLHHAVANGYLELVKVILENKININLQNDKDETPIIVACKNKQYQVFEFLLKQKADITLKDNNNNTVITLAQQYASRNGDSTLEDILIKNNIELPLKLGEIDINETDKKGNTALHLATKDGTLEKMQELIKRGVNVNLQNKQGKTALMLAKWFDERELLIKNGTNVNLQDSYGKTALIYLMDDNYYGDDDKKSFDLFMSIKNIDVNLQTKVGMTALMYVCKVTWDVSYYILNPFRFSRYFLYVVLLKK